LVLIDKLDGLQAAAALVSFIGATTFFPELPAGSRARSLRVLFERHTNEGSVFELANDGVLRRSVVDVQRVGLTFVEVSDRDLVGSLYHCGRRIECNAVTEVLARRVLRESDECGVAHVRREHGIDVRLVRHLDVKVHITTAHRRVSSLAVKLVKYRGLVLEVLGWEGRLVVHLEGVGSERIHVMVVMLLLLLLLHCMCKRVHVRKLRSMEG